jgi:hypothetical protein
VSCEGYDSSEEEDDDESTDEVLMAGSFLCARSSDEDDDGETVGTLMMESKVTMAPPMMTVPEMMAATTAAAMTIVTWESKIKPSQRQLQVRKTNPRFNFKPSSIVEALNGRILEHRCGRLWSEGKTSTFAELSE